MSEPVSNPYKFPASRIPCATIEAVQFNGGIQSADKAIAWCIEKGAGPGIRYVRLGDTIDIKTLEGTMSANAGDWIIRGIQGEFYPCKPEIFGNTYEPADEEVTA